MKLTSSAAVATSLSLSAVAVIGCTGSGHQTAAPPEPTAQPSTETASNEPSFAVFPVVQFWPGTGQWPPSQILGPQVWPTVAATDMPTSTIDVIEVTAPPPGASMPATDPATTAAVQAQVGATESAYETAVRNPEDRSLLAGIEAATVEGSPARTEFVTAYEAIVAAGHRSVPDPEVPNSIELVVPPFIDPDGLGALVVICHVSGDSVVSATGETVSDRRNAWLLVQEFRRVDGVWKLFERQALDVTPEGTECESPITTSDEAPSSPPSSVP